MINYSYITCKNAISCTKLPDLNYSLNPYFGCEHGCIYCYSPSVFRDEKIAKNWGKFVKAKINIVEALSTQLKSLKKGKVGISTVTDPYQPLEAKLQLTRKCIELLSTHNFPISIQTKSPLVLRDRDLIKPRGFDVGVTITTLDDDLARKLEPRAPSPRSLIQVIEEFYDKGVNTWIFLGPIIPEINDDDDSILQIIDLAKKTKSEIIYDKLNLRPWVLDSMASFLEKERTGLEDHLPSLVTKNSEYWCRLKAKIEDTCLSRGVRCKPAFP
ncbi:MAG: radical SAM protein [archaeon]|nr:radical SAM protein [archaeon]MCP8314728.1 radical SAM protein [archaeon]MCP8316092.1 radical SAM protein [archaeon]MCP8319889.1 radical SAM protein [archaeon]